MPRPNWVGLNSSLGNIGNAFAQRQQQENDFKQQLALYQYQQQMEQENSFKKLMFEEQFKKIIAQQQFEEGMKRIRENPEMFGMGGQGGQFQGMGGQPSFQGISSMPQNMPVPQAQFQPPSQGQPAMSLPSGGQGDVQGNPLLSSGSLKAALGRIQGQGLQQPQQITKSPSTPQNRPQQRGQNPFILDPSTLLSGKVDFIKNPDYESPYQQERNKRQDMGQATRIRQEFINRPEVKDYILVKTKASQLDALLNSALSGNQNNKIAIHQGIISLFNKITDPQSVVRESEYARTPQNAPVVNKIFGAFEKIQQGGAGITNDDLKAIVIGAKILANESGKIYQNTLGEYKALAGDLGIDENLITRAMPEYQDWDVSQGQNEGLRFNGNSNQQPKINRYKKYTF